MAITCSDCGSVLASPLAPGSNKYKCKHCGGITEATPSVRKVCVQCGVDVAHQPRTKDALGRYYCNPCWTTVVAAQPVPPSHSVPSAQNVISDVGDLDDTGIDVSDSMRQANRPQTADKLSRNEWRLIGLGSVVGLVVVSSLVYFLFLRGHGQTELATARDVAQPETPVAVTATSAKHQSRDTELAAMRQFMYDCAPFALACQRYRSLSQRRTGELQQLASNMNVKGTFNALSEWKQSQKDLFEPARAAKLACEKLPVGGNEVGSFRSSIAEMFLAASNDVLSNDASHDKVWRDYERTLIARMSSAIGMNAESSDIDPRQAEKAWTAMQQSFISATIAADEVIRNASVLVPAFEKELPEIIRSATDLAGTQWEAEQDRRAALARKEQHDQEAVQRAEAQRAEADRLKPAIHSLTQLATAKYNAAGSKANVETWEQRRNAAHMAGNTRDEVNAIQKKEQELKDALAAQQASLSIIQEIKKLPFGDIKAALVMLKADKSFDADLRPFLPDWEKDPQQDQQNDREHQIASLSQLFWKRVEAQVNYVLAEDDHAQLMQKWKRYTDSGQLNAAIQTMRMATAKTNETIAAQQEIMRLNKMIGGYSSDDIEAARKTVLGMPELDRAIRPFVEDDGHYIREIGKIRR